MPETLPPSAAAPSWPHGPTSFELRHGNAKTRVVTAIVAIPIVIGAVWLGGWAFFLFVAAISTGALLEFYWLTEKKGAHPNKPLGVAAGLLLALAFMHGVTDRFILDLFGIEPDVASMMFVRGMFIVALFILFAVVTMIDQMFRGEGSPILNNISTFAGVTYVSLFLSTLIGLRQFFESDVAKATSGQFASTTPGGPHAIVGALIVTAIVVSIWICDSAAYYTGRALGRNKLFERISPKKTWEGAIGGAIAAVVAMIGFRAWFLQYLFLGDAIVIGIIVGVFGQIGDLCESHLKRDAGVKDSSQLIPGHGGLFDRFDSLLFVAPLVYLYLNLVMVLSARW